MKEEETEIWQCIIYSISTDWDNKDEDTGEATRYVKKNQQGIVLEGAKADDVRMHQQNLKHEKGQGLTMHCLKHKVSLWGQGSQEQKQDEAGI